MSSPSAAPTIDDYDFPRNFREIATRLGVEIKEMGFNRATLSAKGKQQTVNLANVRARVASLAPDAKSGAIEYFLRAVLDTMVEGPTPTLDQVRHQLMVRVGPPWNIRGQAASGSGREAPPGHSLVEGFLEVNVVADLPRTIWYIDNKVLGKWATTLDAIYPTAIENLRRRSSASAWRAIPNAPGVQFYETGDSFDGSRILVLRDLFPSWPHLGVMACVPSRDLLMAVRLDSVASLKPAQTMIGICQGAYRDSPYQVSNQAFWFDGQVYERIPVEVDGKQIKIMPTQRLTGALNRLAASEAHR
jgi:hypothetical protein